MSRGELWASAADVPASVEPSAVTIGNFDGVHLGHQAVLRQLQDAAAARGLRPIAMTFNPHPRHVMTGSVVPPLITGYARRDDLIRDLGISVLDLEFTRGFAQHSAEDFVRIFLVELLNAKAVVIGRDSRFGRANEGDLGTMQELGEKLGFEVLVVDELGISASCSRVSSSVIRAAITSGDVGSAAGMLGRPHAVADVIQHGFKRGRELGFPTANFSARPDGLVPADGVYAGLLSVEVPTRADHPDAQMRLAPATISIGTNPTFEDGPLHTIVETYVHGSHDLDLYDKRVRVDFIERLRPTLAFSSIDELVVQMRQDVEVTRRTLGEWAGAR
ncbi:bifunctional riboflavin kinase/FAD synthetase [Helcobacillus massiliensis]|uniref:bifunctional riboflavin kinase/FAD synthetase n=1 Tax=Helcobacillus massiliensis TaxID=521392 RepID=UPI0035CD3AE9